jgi:hypothetical protein
MPVVSASGHVHGLVEDLVEVRDVVRPAFLDARGRFLGGQREMLVQHRQQ